MIAAIAVYAPALATGLVGYDDSWLVADNYIVQDASWESLSTIFFDLDSPRRFVLAPEYLPVRDLSVMLDFALWGTNYGGHHATNLVLYIAAIWLWFAALCELGIERRIAGIAVLIWALHPSHAESVAWLAERKGLLGVMFAGATALCYARYRTGRSAVWLAAATLLAVLAVWSKAHAAFAIGALAVLELVVPARRSSWRRSLVGLAVIGAFAAAAFVPVLVTAWKSSVVGSETAPAGRLAMIAGVHGFYIQLALMTKANAVSYPLSTDGPSAIDIVLGIAGFVAIAGVMWRVPRLRPAAVLWLFGWLPVGHLVLPLEMIFIADRYLLVPSLGLALACAIGIGRVAKPRLAYALLTVIGLAALVRSLDARTNWRDRVTLWERAVESNPADGSAWSSYADAVVDGEQARTIVEQGLAHSRHPRLLLRRALLASGTEQVALMREAAEAGEPRAMSNLALLLLEVGHLDEALAWARRGAAQGELYEPGQRALGRVALAAKQLAEARTAFERAHVLKPSCTNAYNLALAELELGALDAAASRIAGCRADATLGPRVEALLAEIARRRQR
jgi:hypothetical protein